MKYVLTNKNIIFAIHDDNQDILNLYSNMKIWKTDLIHHLEEEVTPVWQDETDFINACKQFRNVCLIIGKAIENLNFKGGFDEYAIFINSDFAQNNPAQAGLYASMWSGANLHCKYLGSKLGYGQPEWWYKCWLMNILDGE